MAEASVPVGIVGAGPVGLAAAARLAGLGVPSVVLEADPRLKAQGSKACLIQGDVLEVLDAVGCADEIAQEGVDWHVAHTYVRDREIRRTVYPKPIGYGPFVNISQYRIEQVLLARVEADPRTEVRWSHRVTDIDQSDSHVTVWVETPAGREALRFRYVVAADGVRSAMRAITGVEWTGYSHKDRFLITDIRAELGLPQHRHFHYDPAANPGRQLVIHPQPDDVWRIDWQLAPDSDIDTELATDAFDRRVRAVIGEVPYEVRWLSTYRFHQRVVDRFKVGRVLLAGDAAHALPPYGARGMNSGIQDADNLAWKLAAVLHGQADEGLVETYHEERHLAAKENLRVTEATIRFMVPPSRLRQWARSALLRLSGPIKPLRDHVNSGRMAEPFVYRDSRLVDAADRHPMVGRFAPDGWVSLDGRRQRIRRLFGGEFVVLAISAHASDAQRLIDAVRASQPLAAPLRVAVLLDSEEPRWPEAAGLDVPVTVGRLEDPTLPGAYRADRATWLLVRPDGHIAAVSHRPDRAWLVAALARSVGAGGPAATEHPEALGVPG